MSAHIDKPTDLIDPATGAAWTPAFDGQRPPFQPGNQLAVRHGIHSPAKVGPLADAFKAALLERLPDDHHLRTMPMFDFAVDRWALIQAKVQLLVEHVDTMTMEQAAYSGKGQTSPLELLRKWLATAQTADARMGLDPLSRARLGKDVSQGRAADAATLLTGLRAAHEAADQDD